MLPLVASVLITAIVTYVSQNISAHTISATGNHFATVWDQNFPPRVYRVNVINDGSTSESKRPNAEYGLDMVMYAHSNDVTIVDGANNQDPTKKKCITKITSKFPFCFGIPGIPKTEYSDQTKTESITRWNRLDCIDNNKDLNICWRSGKELLWPDHSVDAQAEYTVPIHLDSYPKWVWWPLGSTKTFEVSYQVD